MRLLRRLAAYGRIARGARRNRGDALSWLARRPALLVAVGVYETAVLISNRADTRMKYLATVRTSSLVGCPF